MLGTVPWCVALSFRDTLNVLGTSMSGHGQLCFCACYGYLVACVLVQDSYTLGSILSFSGHVVDSNLPLNWSLNVQIRVLIYLAALTYGIMEGMAELERSLVVAVGSEEHVEQHALHASQQQVLRGTLLSMLQHDTRFCCAEGKDKC